MVFIYYSTKLIGADYLIIKGASIGAVTYGLIDLLMGVLSKNPEVLQKTSGHFVHASAAMLGGALGGLFIKRYLLPDPAAYKKNVRRFSIVPEPSYKRVRTKKVRFVKPKKL